MTFTRLFSSLRSKLLIFSLALVVVPGLVFGFIAYESARRGLQDAVGRMLAEVAHDAAADVNGLLKREAWTVRTWAQQDLIREVSTGDREGRISRFLSSLKASDVGYVDLVCTDASGAVVAASSASFVGGIHGERPWYRATQAGKDYLVGPVTRDAHRFPVLEIASPIFDSAQPDRVIGALLGWYAWDRVAEVTRNVRKNSEAIDLDVDVVLLDEHGTVIAQAGDRTFGPLAGHNLHEAGWIAPQRSLERKRPGYVRESKVAALVGYARVKGDRAWVALAAQQPREALGPVYQMRTRLRWLLTAVLVSALGVAIVLADRTSRPLRALTAATKEIARAGAIREPVPVRSRDEIGELAAAFNTMARDLQQAQEQLVTAAKFAFVGEVAAGIAHEVRTPLGILRSSAQLFARSIPKDQPKQAELLEMMIGEVDRLDRVVASLLELARPRHPLIEPTPLTPVLSRALDFVAAQARGCGVTLERAFTDGDRSALCDPDQIYQVALNLIVNALQAMPRGGTLTVRGVCPADGRVGFEVSDTGAGIAPEIRGQIFTPFFTMREGGTGLGLALVERVVQAHRGTVTVASEVGKGTTFRVELPAAEVQ